MGEIIRGTIVQGENAPLVLRLVGDNGSLIVPTDVTQYRIDVFDLSSVSPETSVWSSGNLGAGTSPPFYATLQLDGFAFDAVGYNFRTTVTHAAVGFRSGRQYEVQLTVTSTTWGVRKFIARLNIAFASLPTA